MKKNTKNHNLELLIFQLFNVASLQDCQLRPRATLKNVYGLISQLCESLTSARQHVDHSGRDASPGGQLCKLERCERTDLRGFDDDGVAGCEACSHLPREHHQRVIPWSDQPTHPVQDVD